MKKGQSDQPKNDILEPADIASEFILVTCLTMPRRSESMCGRTSRTNLYKLDGYMQSLGESMQAQ